MVAETRAAKRKRSDSITTTSSSDQAAPAPSTTRRVTRATSAALASASEPEPAPPAPKRAKKAPSRAPSAAPSNTRSKKGAAAKKPTKAKKTTKAASTVAQSEASEPVTQQQPEPELEPEPEQQKSPEQSKAPEQQKAPETQRQGSKERALYPADIEPSFLSALGPRPKYSLRNPCRDHFFFAKIHAEVAEKEAAEKEAADKEAAEKEAAEKAEKEAAEAAEAAAAETTPVQQGTTEIQTTPAPALGFLSRLISTVSSPFRQTQQVATAPAPDPVVQQQTPTPSVLRSPQVSTLKRKRVEHQVAVLTTISESPEISTMSNGLIPKAPKTPVRVRRTVKEARAARARRQAEAELALRVQREPVIERPTKRVKVDHLRTIPHNRPGDPEGCFRAPDFDENSEMEVDVDVTVLSNPFEHDDEPTPKPAKKPYDYGFSYSDEDVSDHEEETETNKTTQQPPRSPVYVEETETNKTPQQPPKSPVYPATAPAKTITRPLSPVKPQPIVIPDNVPSLSSGPTSAETGDISEDENGEYTWPYNSPRDPNEPESTEEFKEECYQEFMRGMAHFEATGEILDFD